ncbi:MAG: isoleucine--tRNA ligase [Phycisphaerae bacterium]|nr:isoleucine--tRNA ligase [Phycisphaerae bacterium]MDW8261505.1 isoleucine--tRNA ligase [Phycisphaerales bacterium]
MSTETKPASVYKDTLNLPRTAFPMEARLVSSEPARLRKWQEMNLYEQLMRLRAHAPRWVLHDGPPFANSDIHIGHVANKTLKDVFIRYKSLAGFQCPFVPGWDCHGLPIEHKIQQDLGAKLRDMSLVEVRKHCYAHAEKYARVQSEQFQRLGILGDWSRPYWTMAPEYEASTLEVFAEFVAAGLVYKQLKPVHWSIENMTALADAELEYQDVEDPSVYVEFPVENPGLLKGRFELRVNAPVSYLIWTTTPWTLPANVAIAVHPDVEYAFVQYTRNGRDRISVVAAPLVEVTWKGRQGVSEFRVVRTVTGRELLAAGVGYRHPFMDKTLRLVGATYVTTTDGTGLVHTAGGHGEEDYATCIANGIEIYCPVLANGRFDSTVPEWLTGLNVWEANPRIIQKLRELDVLFDTQTIRHTYPHDWRSKTKTIFRATEQWFIAVDREFRVGGGNGVEEPATLRQRAMRAIRDQIRFVPEWGRARIGGMFESRPDWCISRQRAWGLPIPVFYNEQGEALLTAESVRAVARRFREKGSDAWFTDSPMELLGDYDPGPRFPKDRLRKEKDIFDVWFESGSSWHAVCRKRPELGFPADLYLEGSDQHRGWFQLSLLPALGATGVPPFKTVLTHGFIVGPDGRKVSKSDPNYVTATEEVNRHGADLLRLFVCQSDYEGDMAASPKMIREFGDKYRKIRNTLRYLLSNLYDFDPARHAQEIPLHSLDGWAWAELDELIRQTVAAYDSFALHRAFRLLHDFCAVQVSAVYGNAMKDRLYCEPPHSALRRRCQTVMHRMVVALTKLLSPMIVFTADEAWEHITHKPAGEEHLPSVHLTSLPRPSGVVVSEAQQEEWRLLMRLREDALLQLDRLKKQAGLNKALDAEIVYHVDDDELRRRLQQYGPDLEDLVGAGFHSFAEKDPSGPAVTVKVIDRRGDYKACARSWKRRPDVGQDPEFPELSLRDAAAVRQR